MCNVLLALGPFRPFLPLSSDPRAIVPLSLRERKTPTSGIPHMPRGFQAIIILHSFQVMSCHVDSFTFGLSHSRPTFAFTA